MPKAYMGTYELPTCQSAPQGVAALQWGVLQPPPPTYMAWAGAAKWGTSANLLLGVHLPPSISRGHTPQHCSHTPAKAAHPSTGCLHDARCRMKDVGCRVQNEACRV